MISIELFFPEETCPIIVVKIEMRNKKVLTGSIVTPVLL